MNTVIIAIADEYNGDTFVIDSRNDKEFFRGWGKDMYTRSYRILKTIETEESRFEECLEKMMDISNADTHMSLREIRDRSDKVYIDYDCMFKDVVDKKKLYEIYQIPEGLQ